MTTSQTTEITIRRTINGWTAMFRNDPTMPNGVALPLPFSAAAPRTMVVADLGRRFALATIITKAA